MSSLLTRGADMLASAHSNLLGVTITYRRGNTSASFKATLGSTLLQTQDQDGVIRENKTRDFIFPVAALSFLGANSEPRKGDEIEMVEAGVATLYQLRPGANEQCFRMSDHGGRIVRVFTARTARPA